MGDLKGALDHHHAEDLYGEDAVMRFRPASLSLHRAEL